MTVPFVIKKTILLVCQRQNGRRVDEKKIEFINLYIFFLKNA